MAASSAWTTANPNNVEQRLAVEGGNFDRVNSTLGHGANPGRADQTAFVRQLVGDGAIVEKTNRSVDYWTGDSMTDTGLAYNISGRATVLESSVGESLASFHDPIKAIFGTTICKDKTVIVTRKYVVGGVATMTPERAPARTVQVRHDVQKVQLQRYGGDVTMNTNLFMLPGEAQEELDMKLNAQKRTLENKLVELGWQEIFDKATRLPDTAVRANPTFAPPGDVDSPAAREYARLVYFRTCFGAFAKHEFPIANLLAACKTSRAYTSADGPGTVLVLPHGSSEMLRYTKASSMNYSVSGLRTADQKPVTMTIDNVATDPSSGVKIMVHVPMSDYSRGSALPSTTAGLLSETVSLFMVYPTDKAALTKIPGSGRRGLVYPNLQSGGWTAFPSKDRWGIPIYNTYTGHRVNEQYKKFYEPTMGMMGSKTPMAGGMFDTKVINSDQLARLQLTAHIMQGMKYNKQMTKRDIELAAGVIQNSFGVLPTSKLFGGYIDEGAQKPYDSAAAAAAADETITARKLLQNAVAAAAFEPVKYVGAPSMRQLETAGLSGDSDAAIVHAFDVLSKKIEFLREKLRGCKTVADLIRVYAKSICIELGDRATRNLVGALTLSYTDDNNTPDCVFEVIMSTGIATECNAHDVDRNVTAVLAWMISSVAGNMRITECFSPSVQSQLSAINRWISQSLGNENVSAQLLPVTPNEMFNLWGIAGISAADQAKQNIGRQGNHMAKLAFVAEHVWQALSHGDTECIVDIAVVVSAVKNHPNESELKNYFADVGFPGVFAWKTMKAIVDSTSADSKIHLGILEYLIGIAGLENIDYFESESFKAFTEKDDLDCATYHEYLKTKYGGGNSDEASYAHKQTMFQQIKKQLERKDMKQALIAQVASVGSNPNPLGEAFRDIILNVQRGNIAGCFIAMMKARSYLKNASDTDKATAFLQFAVQQAMTGVDLKTNAKSTQHKTLTQQPRFDQRDAQRIAVQGAMSSMVGKSAKLRPDYDNALRGENWRADDTHPADEAPAWDSATWASMPEAEAPLIVKQKKLFADDLRDKNADMTEPEIKALVDKTYAPIEGLAPQARHVLVRELKVKMSSAVIAKCGSETGELLVGYPMTSISTNQRTEAMTVALRVYLGAILKKPENVTVIPHVAFEGIISDEFFYAAEIAGMNADEQPVESPGTRFREIVPTRGGNHTAREGYAYSGAWKNESNPKLKGGCNMGPLGHLDDPYYMDCVNGLQVYRGRESREGHST